MRPLSPAELEIVVEEEALLLRVRQYLASREHSPIAGAPAYTPEEDLRRRATELRDEAIGARAEDLPALFDQLHNLRAVAERRRAVPLPDRACPYFAHLRVREGNTRRDYLLGQVPLLDGAQELGARIVDWRHAPIAQIFYRYREGDPIEEELPGRRLSGVLELRRVVVIIDGRLRSVTTPAGTLERDAAGANANANANAHANAANTNEWRAVEEGAMLGGGEGTAERGLLGTGAGRGERVVPNIAALLDPVQFDILHAHGADPLLLVGIAGSGKTTIALHRLAVLRHDEPLRFEPKRLAVVVPELGVARLARRILGPLGLGETGVHTFVDWAEAELRRAAPQLSLRITDETPTEVARLKRHPALLAALPAWISAPENERRRRDSDVKELRYWLFTDRAFLGQVAARAGLSAATVEATVRRAVRQADVSTEARHRGTDAARLATLDGRSLDAGSDEELAGKLDEEDLAILLELLRITRPPALRKKSHLVLDEAQELAPIELRALGQALESPRSFTVAGDDLQRTGVDADFGGWETVLAELGAPGAARRELAVGYRCPLPIAVLAEQVLGPLSSGRTPSGRPGAPVGHHRFPHTGAQALFLQDAIAELLDREPRASLAVLVRNPESATRWARDLEHLRHVRLVRGGDFSFAPGVDVCEVTEAKGLEFDYVVIPDADASQWPVTDESRRLLYVAITRATHQLWLSSVGTPSLLLGRDGGRA